MFRLSCAALLFAGCAAAPEADRLLVETQSHALSNVDINRSLIVTEEPILARFSFARVMNQLVAQSGVPGLTALGLFQQWWDTQNPASEAVVPGNIHCDDQLDYQGGPGINTYPYRCRPASAGMEGSEALSDPFANPGTNPGEYVPVALTNRFDLAPHDGANCGEHRVVYARRSGMDLLTGGRNRNLIIFEATMPNPQPAQGLRGCDKIVKFWADLSKWSDLDKRADELERFYFAGEASLPPVISIAHFGDNAAGVGQIRTNQFMQPVPITPVVWNLREFKLLRTCAGNACSAMRVVPVTVKVNPFGGLFNPGTAHPQKLAFDAHFETQVESLAAATVNGISMGTPDVLNAAQSLASGSPEDNYVTQFAGPSALRAAVQAKLTLLGSSLTPDNIAARAMAMSCAGCHRLNDNDTTAPIGGDIVWPKSAGTGFVHINERAQVVGADGVTRFDISPALKDEFLPARKGILDDFMDNKPPKPPKHPSDPLGGRRTH